MLIDGPKMLWVLGDNSTLFTAVDARWRSTPYRIGHIVICARVAMLETFLYVLYEFFKYVFPIRIVNELDDLIMPSETEYGVWHDI
ncbi:hypothetical protein AWZ03_010304 [Drosophila navojoa]|uniref:Uncharacterized protein n=1 Tax=Drosophila navojoa TaxID=7232 RepID=A0A484B3H4_DRONA|nr:hypothetical protein AWZ03_010304 [Drosophila navojoa]